MNLGRSYMLHSLISKVILQACNLAHVIANSKKLWRFVLLVMQLKYSL